MIIIPYILFIIGNLLNWFPALNRIDSNDTNKNCKLTNNVNVNLINYWYFILILIIFGVVLDCILTESSYNLFKKWKIFSAHYKLRMKRIERMNELLLSTDNAVVIQKNLDTIPLASNRHFERPRRVIYIVLDLVWMIIMTFTWFGFSWLALLTDYYIKKLL